MIADGFKDDKYTSRDLKGSKIFSKFAQKLYKKWTQETGELRTEASIKCHEDGLNFWRLHYYFAVESLFPELVEVLFPDFDISEWPEEEVIACGFMTIIGGKFLFLHETFREYFLVDFITKTLEKPKINGKIVELIVKILTIKKYKVVQLFLNDAIENHKVLDKILPEMQKYVDNFYFLDYFGEFFVNNLENLAYLLIKLLKNADYEKVKKMLEKSAKDIMKRSNDQKIVLKFQEFLVDFLNVEDLRKLLIKEELFYEIIGSSNNIEAFDDLVTKIESKVGSEIVQQGLMQMSSDTKKGNIFWFLCISRNISFISRKVQKCLKIVEKFLSISEIMELIEKCNHKDQNVFEFMVEEDLEFRLFWEGCMDILRMEVALPTIKRMFKKSNSKEELLLHTAAEYSNLKFHEDLWEILLKAFDQHEELNEIIMQKDSNDDSFIHLIVIFNTADVIEFSIQKLKETLNESDYQEMLRSKGQSGRNLLQIAAVESKKLKTYQSLWQELQESCKSNEEFLEIITEVDNEGDNVIHHSAAFTTSKVFKFMILELEKIVFHDEIKKLLINLGFNRRNLMQEAAVQNKSLELNKAIWEIVEKYFDSSEILQFIKHRDVFGDNLLLNAINENTKDVKELTCNKVKNILITIGYENNENFKLCDKIMKNISNFDELTKEKEQILKLDWIDDTNEVKLFDDSNKLIAEKSIKNLKDLMLFVADEKLENHEILWRNLEENMKNYDELKKVLFEKNKDENNFIHLLIKYNKADVIEVTINKFKKSLNESDYQEILQSKGEFNRNLFQVAAVNSTEVKTHQILWKKLQDSCKSDKEFLKILVETDEDGDNVFHLAASFTTSEVLEFMISELEKLTSPDNIKKLFIQLGCGNQNLIQAASKNKSLELNEMMWKILHKYFNYPEILQFIKHLDEDGDNLLVIAKECSTSEVLELIWNEVKNNISALYRDEVTFHNIRECEKIIQTIAESKDKENDEEDSEDEDDDDLDLLNLDWIGNQYYGTSYLFDEFTQFISRNNLNVKTLEDLMIIVSNKNITNHKILWEYYLKKFETRDDLSKLFSEKDENDDNFIHLLVISNTADVIEFTIQKLKENLNESDYQEIIRSKGEFGRNLLQVAATNSNELKTHHFLWKELQDSCKTNEEFLKILEQVDEDDDNVFLLAASFTTSEVFEFMISELEKLTSDKEIRIFLTSLGQKNKNLLQTVVIDNKSLETHKSIWKIICSYFDNEEILKLINHCDKDSNNILCNAILYNTKEIVEFTWNQIKKFIITNDAQFEYLNRKGQNGKSLHQISLENEEDDDSELAEWVQDVMQEYEIPISQ